MSDFNFDLLDQSIDELADLEGFEPLPAGTHRVSINWDTKEINDKPAVTLSMKLLECIECSDSRQEPPEPGKTSDIAYLLKKDDGEDNKISQGQLKEVLLALQPYVGGDLSREIMENSDGAEVIVTLKVRPSKKDPDQKFNDIKSLVWPE